MYTTPLNKITKTHTPFQSFSSDPETAAATAIIHGDVHGSGESLLDRLGVIMSDDDRRCYEQISQHTYVEQYYQLNLHRDALLLKQKETKNKETRDFFKLLIKQKDKLLTILAKHIREDLMTKKALFERIDIADPEKFRLLLGDVTGDRGCSELDIFLLLAALIKKGLNVKILLGNHDLETLLTILTNNWKIDAKFFGISDSMSMRSLIILKILLHYGFVTHEELSPLIEVWKGLLEPLYYFWKPGQTLLCKHAPNGFEIYEKLAAACGTSYNDMTDIALYQSLDDIRTVFKVSLNKPESDPTSFLSQLRHPETREAWTRLTWNRDYDSICTHKEGQSYESRHLNGHDTPVDAQQSPTESLDNCWRKNVAYRVKYYLESDNIKFTERIPKKIQPNTFYCHALDENLIAYYGILNQGHYACGKFTDFGKLPPHYFSGVIQTDSLDKLHELLLEDIQKNSIIAALPILPLRYPHQPELTYVITDYALADTPRPLQASSKKRVSTDTETVPPSPLSPLSPEQLSSRNNKRSKIDHNSSVTSSLCDVFDAENVVNASSFASKDKSGSNFSFQGGSFFTAATGKQSSFVDFKQVEIYSSEMGCS